MKKNKGKKKMSQCGVTLMELLAVILLVGIAAGGVLYTYDRRSQEDLRENSRNFLGSMLTAARQYELQHPAVLTGGRTNQNWIDNWKTYLQHYTAKQNDLTNDPFAPVLDIGLGKNAVRYYIREDGAGVLQMVASYQSMGGVDFLNWNHVSGSEDFINAGGGGVCISDGECYENHCLTATCLGDGTCENLVIDCNDGNQCTDDSCDPATGCVFDPVPMNGSGCDDGDLCTNGDQCQNGVCVPGTPESCATNDSEICQSQKCYPETGGCEIYRNTEPCDDGNQCTSAGLCDGAGICDPGPNLPDGTTCNDGILTNCDDTCTAGVCSGVPC